MVKSKQSSKTFLAHNLSKICHTKCEETSDETDKSLCKFKCDNVSQVPESHSQISEKLTDIANNLHNEAEELSSIAGDLVYF